MMLQILKAKLQGVIVSESNINYPGSISLPEELLRASGIKQFELVYVNNRTNGSRIVTYAVKSKREGFVSVNGAASHHFKSGDTVHVLSYCNLSAEEADVFQPVLVITDKDNRLVESKPYTFE
jgi:aspartate 1-decarboxylase